MAIFSPNYCHWGLFVVYVGLYVGHVCVSTIQCTLMVILLFLVFDEIVPP